MTWLGIIVIAFMVLLCFIGYRRGFVREIFSLLYIVLTVILVGIINPYVSDFLKEYTPIYTAVENQCSKTISKQITSGESSEETAEDASEESLQTSVIQSLFLPSSVKDDMEDNNTAEGYDYLMVDSFTGYISSYLSNIIVNGISYVVSFIIIYLLLHLLAFAINSVAQLPGLRIINRLGGGLVGLLKGVLVIWIVFLVLTILYNTEIGEQALQMIDRDFVLSFLYENDILIDIVLNIFN